MESPFGRMHVVVNPRAGRGAVERGWPAVKAVLDEARLSYGLTITERRGHGAEATRAAIEGGCRFVVAVGGDGTVHEVVNGMMTPDGPLSPDVVLGAVAAGSGCDFVKTIGLPQAPAEAAAHLLGETLWGELDVARIRYVEREGKFATRWFVNIAEAGLGADVVAAAAKMPKWLGGRVYRLAAIKEIARHRPREATIRMHARKARGTRVDAPLEEIVHQGPISMLVVANCQFYGGGMQVAPRATPADGLLDVQIAHGTKSEAVKAMAKISKGAHVPSKTIAEFLATTVSLEAPEPILIEADGEVLGTSPATFEITPRAIKLKV
jgi:YegS/Rv2252/BmrU family lipid kinase